MIPISRVCTKQFSGLFYDIGFFARTMKSAYSLVVHGKVSHGIFVFQVLFTFVEALSITFLISFGIGAALTAFGLPFLESFSKESLLFPLLIAIIARELGPLFTAIIVIARSATAIATELASMVITHEVEAYIATGLDPIEHLAAPRFLGVSFSVFLLNIYFLIFGFLGSFLVAVLFYQLPPAAFVSGFFQVLSIKDVLISLIKGICFGTIISIISIVKGFSVERSSTEIPVAGLRAVSAALAWCIVADVVLSGLYYVCAS
ncbi:MAG: ABC transporter permease [Spirochaetaceae bacterium]|nr:ABC transporter permease [Spirochaetaceae bacterium]